MGEEALKIARPGWLPTGSADTHFVPVVGSPVRNSATCWACSSCLASSSWRQRRNGSLGAGFAGLLVMVLNSDSLVGCLGIAKALQVGGFPGSGCTQALAYRLCDFLLGASHRRRQL